MVEVEVRYRKGFGEWRLHPLDKLFGGVGLRDKSTSPFNVFFSSCLSFSANRKRKIRRKKNKQINKNMGGAVLRPHPDRSQPSCTEIKTGNLGLRAT